MNYVHRSLRSLAMPKYCCVEGNTKVTSQSVASAI